MFHDSKIAEHEIGSAVSILTHFQETGTQREKPQNHTGGDSTAKTAQKNEGGSSTANIVQKRADGDDSTETEWKGTERDLAGLSTDEVLEEYNIYRNPSWVMLKGRGAPLDLPMGIGISNEDIDRIPWNRASAPKRILTIENLTSFHQWKTEAGEDDLVIYLGGYANRAWRDMLKKLHEIYPDASFAHFGDIDAGGFRIWKHLCLSTGLPIGTYLMDEATYLQYLKYGRELTAHDRKALQQMSEDPFFRNQKELFACMLKQGKKLEQECIGTD